MKRQFYIFLLAIISTSAGYSQESLSRPLHFDDEFNVTDPQYASFKGYTEFDHNGFATTLFGDSAIKVAKITFADKELTSRHGAFIAFHANGEVLLKSHYKRNSLHGEWRSWYKNGLLCDSGTLVKSLPHGTWKGWFENGQLRSIRTFSEPKYHILKAELKKHPRFTFLPLTSIIKQDPNALNLYTNAVNSYKSLSLSGLPAVTSALSLKQIADINTSRGSHLYLPPFAKCLHHGLYMNFYQGGNVKDSGYYKNGLKEGVWRESLEGGNIRSTGFYYHGRKKHTWKFYDASGKLLYIQHYNRAGKPVGPKESMTN